MRRVGSDVLKLGLDTLRVTRAHRLLGGGWRGLGAIFMLHRVVPRMADEGTFAPNRGLEVTPAFLGAVLRRVKQLGYEIIDLDEMTKRLRAGGPGPFAVFTFDDGYRDNLELALPIFEAHRAPMAVYVTSDMPDGTADPWWIVLERSIRALDEIEMEIGGEVIHHPTRTDTEKRNAWETVYWRLRDLQEDDMRYAVATLAAAAGVDRAKVVKELALTWEEVRALDANPLVTIGAHTAGHYALSGLPNERVYEEIAAGTARLADELGHRPRHFAYPYGDESSAGPREFELVTGHGFASAVTTRKGLLFPAHGNHLRALPRLSLNGDFQNVDLVDVLLGGAPFALWNRFKRVNVA